MRKLSWHDMQFALLRLPRSLTKVMKSDVWAGRIFVGGGYLRAIVSGEEISDVDVFTTDKTAAEALATRLLYEEHPTKDFSQITKLIFTSENALSFSLGGRQVQIIHRWCFSEPKDIINSFDFTVCCAVFFFSPEGGVWDSYVHDKFYPDLAAHRLTYLAPKREEAPGGSMLRVLKYYQKGYRIPLDSLGKIMARMFCAVDHRKAETEFMVAKVLTGMLHEVDPSVDPTHVAHLPAEGASVEEAVDIASE